MKNRLKKDRFILDVTVVIPACNEQANIRNMLLSVLDQQQNGFAIKKIVVISDGSTDKTVEIAKSIRDPRIIIKAYNQRKGKAVRLNQAFREFDGDILVQLDADIKLEHGLVLERLFRPFRTFPNTAVVCGWHVPLAPKTYVEKILYFGTTAWHKILDAIGEDAEFYYCTGMIMAFSRQFVKSFQIPAEQAAFEDLYTFYFAKAHKFKVVVARTAVVAFRLPTTVNDYIKQMMRTIRAEKEIKKLLEEINYTRHKAMTSALKLKVLAREAWRAPLGTVLGYFLLQAVAKFKARYYISSNTWDMAASTKQLKSS